MPAAGDVERVIARTSWAVLVVGMTINQLVSMTASERVSQTVLVVMMGVFFPLLLARLGVAWWRHHRRRMALALLLSAVMTWSLGAMIVNANKVETEQQFPAPGEFLFLISYLGMVAYLTLDIDYRQRLTLRGWLDLAVICGGTACLASLLLVTPIRVASGEQGISLLLALVYPIADTVLALAALSQWLRRVRSDWRKSLLLVSAFALLACADSSFALLVSAHSYQFSVVSQALWGLAFALLVEAACRQKQPAVRALPKAAGTTVLVSAGAVALAVLAIHPDETLSYYVLPPAVVTSVCVGARLVLALRDANKAAEAFAPSLTDDLTNLPNRRAVRARLRERLRDRLNDDRALALMLLDVDRFKEINDSLGHRAGDTVLGLVAVRLVDAVGSGAMVARLGGDEFAIILESPDEIELLEVARFLLEELARPLSVDGIEICPTGSIGVAVATGDVTDAGEIMRRADVAMYQAKNSGSGAALYDIQLDDFTRSHLRFAEELRRGLADGQIEVWYQPQFVAGTSRIAALEALVRWRHPTEGVISPVSFLPAVRRAGLMGTLSDAVVRQTVSDLCRLQGLGPDVHVAVNCAPLELLDPAFLSHLLDVLKRNEVAPDRLVLEITEDSFLVDAEQTREVLHRLRDHGVQVSVDDYGTGFSSLTYLRNLPIQELKIDRSLIANVAGDERSRMIVASTIQLTRALDMRSVAEGVENAVELDALVSMGIDRVQGYHLARPMPLAELVARFGDRGSEPHYEGMDHR